MFGVLELFETTRLL